MGETVQLITRQQTGVDRYNKPTYVDVETPVAGVGVAPVTSTTDPTTGAVITTAGMALYLPADVTCDADARFRVRGRVFKVRGASENWTSLFSSWQPGNVVRLEDRDYVDG
ncbi:hypothetical protein DEI99_005275 [Curtobacterium sp. MCLR17_036]|uniref:hypothetical protein n=1 Tax=Curtobacterium sp. MCLR17_036 TaxID=2175620 RepID=UPI000DAA37CF|nr:hypothetical protein [Curtobacterium sp. MCLR17_036]WIE65951.1 hypothetical protein DEI99_005275 [Curtobacterium sp. MCLR17_036]